MRFAYKAKQGPQKIVDGTIDAQNLEGAIAQILERGLTPVDVRARETPAASKSASAHKHRFSLFRRVSSAEVVAFTRQVSDLLTAGVPLLRALTIVDRQIKPSVFKERVKQMILTVRDGGSFSSALSQSPDAFPLLYAHMVRSGELAGNLDVVMTRLADFMEKDQDVRTQMVTALIYPALIMVTGIITVFVLLTWVIPKITIIFEDLNQTLPLPTVVLMAVSDFFVQFWWMILLAAAAAGLYVTRFYATPGGRLWLDRVKLRIPLAGDFLKDVQLGRFARTLGTLLESGVGIITALESVSMVMDNEVLRQEAREIAAQVKDGQSLTGAVRDKKYFPEAAVSMISVGEESGQTEKGLHKLADYHERRSRRFMKRMTSLMEPALILFLGGVVGFVVMAMLLPIFRMNMVIQ